MYVGLASTACYAEFYSYQPSMHLVNPAALQLPGHLLPDTHVMQMQYSKSDINFATTNLNWNPERRLFQMQLWWDVTLDVAQNPCVVCCTFN